MEKKIMICSVCGKEFDAIQEGNVVEDYCFCSEECEVEYEDVKNLGLV